MAIVIGIDPGKSGGLVVLTNAGGVIRCLYQRRTKELCAGTRYLPEFMDAELSRAVGEHGATMAVLEQCSARSLEGRASILSTGIGWGLWRGALASRCPVLEPTPQKWQARILADIAGETKERSIAKAAQVVNLDLKPGRCTTYQDGLADAACLAWYGLLVGSTSASRAA